jgi:cellulase (glycosyl hydrolase family 5)
MSTRSRIVSALTLGLALCAAATAQAAPRMELAVQDDPVLMGRLYGSASNTLKLVSQLRATRLRVNVSWSYVVGNAAKRRTAPRHIAYNWSGYDALIRAATPRGIRLQLTLTGPAPAYATANHRIGPYKPKSSAFRAFATAAATHFRGKVDRYSIWNEPNYVRWLSPLNRGAKLYRALYVAGYGAIKRVDPDAQVLIGETSPTEHRGRSTAPLKFLRGVTCATRTYSAARICDPLVADGYAHHAYDPTHSPAYRYPGADNVTLATLYRLTGALDELAMEGLLITEDGEPLDVYVTEYGFFASGKKHVSARTHAAYLVKAFRMAQANPRVRQMLQYLIVKPRGNYSHFDTSIADKRGRPSLAFKKLAAWARQAVEAGRVAPAEAIRGPCAKLAQSC